MWQVITLSLLILSINAQTQTLVSTQNISSGTNAIGDRVRAVDFSDDGTKLLSVYGNTIRFWTNPAGTWTSAADLAAGGPLEDTKFNSDGTSIIGLANSSNTAYFFTGSGTTFTNSQNITLPFQPISFDWGPASNYTIFGCNDGAIRIYNRTSSGAWNLHQTISSAHSGSVSGISSSRSRFVSCGANDSLVKVWYYNLTTGYYTLQETNTMPGTNCTAIDYSQNQDRYAAGYQSGVIYVRDRNNSYNYTGSSAIITGSQPVYDLRFTPDASKIASASADSNLILTSRNPTSGAWVNNSVLSLYSPYSLDFADNNILASGSVNSTNGSVNIFQVQATNCASSPNVDATTPNNSTTTCNCNAGFSYYGGYCQAVSCSLVNNTGSATAVNSTTCTCATGFTWATNTSSCVRNCAIVNNSLGYNYDDADCYCRTGYTWSNDTCIPYVNCTGLANSPGTNAQSSSCNCNANYMYNTTLSACVLNCTNVANSNGVNTTNYTQCNCSSGYWFNNSFGSNNVSTCLRICNTTTSFVRGNDMTDATKCRCAESFTWNNSTSNCTLDCTKVNYSTTATHSNGSCKCSDDYRWDKVIYRCVSKSGSNKAVAIACGVAIPLGVLGLLGLLGLCLYCKRAPLPPVVTPVYMQPPPAVTTTTTEVIEKVTPAPMVTSTSRIAGPPIVSERLVGHYSGPTYTSTVPNQVIPGGTMTRGFAAGPGGVITGSTAARGTIVGGPAYGGGPLVTSGMGVGGPLLPPPSGIPRRF